MGAFFGPFPVDEASGGGGGGRRACARAPSSTALRSGGGGGAGMQCRRALRCCQGHPLVYVAVVMLIAERATEGRAVHKARRRTVLSKRAVEAWGRRFEGGAPTPAPYRPRSRSLGLWGLQMGYPPCLWRPCALLGDQLPPVMTLFKSVRLGCAIRGTDQVPTTCCCCWTPPPLLQSAADLPWRPLASLTSLKTCRSGPVVWWLPPVRPMN